MPTAERVHTLHHGIIRGGLRSLLISLLLVVAIHPLVDRGAITSAVFLVFSTWVLLSAAYAVSHTKRSLAIALLLAMPAIVTGWSHLFVQTQILHLVSLTFFILFYLYTLLLVLGHVLRAENVTADEIYGALSVYILMGIAWGLGYGILERLAPGSFHSVVSRQVGPADLIYYSFVTLTTVGYGDIYPISPVARSFSIIEAMVGIVFIAVFISRLVGMHTRGPRRED